MERKRNERSIIVNREYLYRAAADIVYGDVVVFYSDRLEIIFTETDESATLDFIELLIVISGRTGKIILIFIE